MSWLGKILSAPIRVVQSVAAVANIASEKALGCDLDIFALEEQAKEIAEEIEERA